MPPIPEIQKATQDPSVLGDPVASQQGQSRPFMSSSNTFFSGGTQKQDFPSSFASSGGSEVFGKKSQLSVFGGSALENATPLTGLFKSSGIFPSKSEDINEANKGSNIFGANASRAQNSELSFKSFNKPHIPSEETLPAKTNASMFASIPSPKTNEGFSALSPGTNLFKRPPEAQFGTFRTPVASSEVPASNPKPSLLFGMKDSSNPFQASQGNLSNPYVFGTTGSDSATSNTFGKPDFSGIFGKKTTENDSTKPAVFFGKPSPAMSPERQNLVNREIFGSTSSTNLRNPFAESSESESMPPVIEKKGEAETEKRKGLKKSLPAPSAFSSASSHGQRQTSFLSSSSNLFSKSIDQVKRSVRAGNQELISG
jgi:hypothetical protein